MQESHIWLEDNSATPSLAVAAFSNAQAKNVSTADVAAMNIHGAGNIRAQKLTNPKMRSSGGTLANLERRWGRARALIMEGMSLVFAALHNVLPFRLRGCPMGASTVPVQTRQAFLQCLSFEHETAPNWLSGFNLRGSSVPPRAHARQNLGVRRGQIDLQEAAPPFCGSSHRHRRATSYNSLRPQP